MVDPALNNQLIISSVLLTPGIFILTWIGVDDFQMLHNDKVVTQHTFLSVFFCIFIGLIAGLIIGYVTKVMTSYSFSPVI